MADMGIGFAADASPDNRYFSPNLGGGAANDLTVYGLQILPWMLRLPVTSVHAEAVAASTGVDAASIVLLRLGNDVPCTIRSSLAARIDEALVIYGTKGRIIIPHAHYADEALLYNADSSQADHYKDEITRNGFTYEIEEVMRCVAGGCTESRTVPHSSVLSCAKVFDLIRESMRK